VDKYPDMGEVTGLRLELGRERDRADAFEAALRKDVLAVIKDALADNSKLEAENARLRAASFITAVPVDEYDKLKADLRNCYTAIRVKDEEKASLNAEIENFKEYLKWHADGHKFAAWEVWRRQQSDAGGQSK
jgi:hypothetical protein